MIQTINPKDPSDTPILPFVADIQRLAVCAGILEGCLTSQGSARRANIAKFYRIFFHEADPVSCYMMCGQILSSGNMQDCDIKTGSQLAEAILNMAEDDNAAIFNSWKNWFINRKKFEALKIFYQATALVHYTLQLNKDEKAKNSVML
jgi:hypothetical protein